MGRLKGITPWNKGLKGVQKTSEDTKRKLSVIQKKFLENNPEHLFRIKTMNTNKPRSEITKNKIRQKAIGRLHTEQTKQRLSDINKGKIAWNIGMKFPEKSKENCHLWRGGIAHEPYSIDWGNTLKRAIRERDHYICQICLCEGYPVHHIDYNKKNCNPINLITLCNSCHGKTNKNREIWMDKLKKRTEK